MNKLEINDLFDQYGSLLTKRQYEILSLYFQEDLSYSEISENLEISRAAVMDAVHRGTNLLEKYEKNIGVLSLKQKIYDILEEETDLETLKEKISGLL